MNHTLLRLLALVTPSRAVINNCISLIDRERQGIGSKVGLSHEQLLEHFREEMLDGANYAEEALNTTRQENLAYVDLRKRIVKRIECCMRRNRHEELDFLKDMLSSHDTYRVLRGELRSTTCTL